MKWNVRRGSRGLSIAVYSPRGDIVCVEAKPDEVEKAVKVLNDMTRFWPVLPITADMVRTRLALEAA